MSSCFLCFNINNVQLFFCFNNVELCLCFTNVELCLCFNNVELCLCFNNVELCLCFNNVELCLCFNYVELCLCFNYVELCFCVQLWRTCWSCSICSAAARRRTTSPISSTSSIWMEIRSVLSFISIYQYVILTVCPPKNRSVHNSVFGILIQESYWTEIIRKSNCFGQCCGSGSGLIRSFWVTRIRIRIWNTGSADPDPKKWTGSATLVLVSFYLVVFNV